MTGDKVQERIAEIKHRVLTYGSGDFYEEDLIWLIEEVERLRSTLPKESDR